jgi:hypothetical protein
MAELCENPGLFSDIVRFSLYHCGSGNYLDYVLRGIDFVPVDRGRLSAVYKRSERTLIDEIFRLVELQLYLIGNFVTTHIASE